VVNDINISGMTSNKNDKNVSHVATKEIILTICIATYNRGGFIGETLSTITPQVTEEIEIIIVDGASTDNTKNVVLGFQEKCQQIKYYRLPEKGGVDRDYCMAVELATGKYCWLFTDDDTLDTNAIRTVMTAIKNNEYALIIVNAALYSRNLACCYVNKFVDYDSNKEYCGLIEQEQFFREMANILTFIGCVVIKRDLWNQRNKELYFGTEFVHVGVIFQAYITEKILFISQPLISIRMNNSQWSIRSFRVWILNWPQIIWSFELFSDDSKRKITPRYPSDHLRRLLYYRATNYYSIKEYRDYVRSNSKMRYTRFLAWTIATLPCVPLNLIMIICALLRRRPWMVKELMSSRCFAVGYFKQLLDVIRKKPSEGPDMNQEENVHR
jgi:abequosyltransferase